jgi:hypothetical protein
MTASSPAPEPSGRAGAAARAAARKRRSRPRSAEWAAPVRLPTGESILSGKPGRAAGWTARVPPTAGPVAPPRHPPRPAERRPAGSNLSGTESAPRPVLHRCPARSRAEPVRLVEARPDSRPAVRWKTLTKHRSPALPTQQRAEARPRESRCAGWSEAVPPAPALRATCSVPPPPARVAEVVWALRRG